MTRLEVDGSLAFAFEDGWLAVKWDEAPERKVREAESESELSAAFAQAWRQDRRRLVLWWERGQFPPSGPGTMDQRWKAHWSAMTNQLKQRVADLCPRVYVGAAPFEGGVSVCDVPKGVAQRRGR